MRTKYPSPHAREALLVLEVASVHAVHAGVVLEGVGDDGGVAKRDAQVEKVVAAGRELETLSVGLYAGHVKRKATEGGLGWTGLSTPANAYAERHLDDAGKLPHLVRRVVLHIGDVLRS